METGSKLINTWKSDFILLAYPLFSTKEIANIVSLTPKYISDWVRYRGVKKELLIDIGFKFGKLTIISKKRTDDRHIAWQCECRCGKTLWKNGTQLLRGIAKSCKSCKFKKDTEHIPWWFFARAKHGAELRNIKFDITIEDLEELIVSQDFKCPLTNLPLLIPSKRSSNGKGLTASLDRIDNDLDYVKNNIQFLFIDANLMKRTYPQNYLISIAHLIAENTNKIEFYPLPEDFVRAGKFSNKNGRTPVSKHKKKK